MPDFPAADRMLRARRAAAGAWGLVLAIALALWAADGVRLSFERVALWPGLRAMVVTMPLAAICGALFGGVVACVVLLGSLGDVAVERPSWRERAMAWLTVGTRADHAARIGHVLALLSALAGGGYVAYRLSYEIVIDMAQPHFVALATLGAHLAALALGALLLAPLRNGWRLLVARGQTVRALAWPLASVGRFVAALTLLGVATATVLAIRNRFTLSYLPWQSLLEVSAALVVGLVVRAGYAHVARGLRRGSWAVLMAAVVASVAVTSTWGEVANSARLLAEQHTLTGAVGYRGLRWALDYDRDGHLDILGGGDCAPRNPAIHPGATDLPENGIDEDCDGEDLTARVVDNPSGYRFVVPADWPERPPIVLITIDAFAANRMAAFGNTSGVTPRIDRLASEAALFRACFAQGPSTRLSFPSMFTSRWDSQIVQRLEGKHPYPIDESELTLAEVLQRAGYDTAAVLPDPYFDPGHWKGITAGFRTVDTSAYRTHHLPHNAAFVTDAAIAELSKPRNRPLFMWVHYYDAHSPHTQPREAERRGAELSDVYDAELWWVDHEVGRLLDALDGSGRERPLIVLTADHGIAFDPTHHAKFNYGYDLYTSVLHVPLIVRVPGAARLQYEHLVSTMDIAPTLANVLRLRDRLPFQGTSLVRELSSGYTTESRRLIHEFYIFENYWKDLDPLEKISLRTERFSLIHDRKRGAFELYDWKRDYYEAQDLSGDPDYAAVFKDLRRQLAFYTYSLHRRPPPVPGQPAVRLR